MPPNDQYASVARGAFYGHVQSPKALFVDSDHNAEWPAPDGDRHQMFAVLVDACVIKSEPVSPRRGFENAL
ncbi:hypothetical protein ACMU_08830 [Actibacterium mucosum KCTC 23349]|uniref:Uncharacterized protein n=1 Tax=Actibacterium mucosum KCTC 23349 TaxID=1454373 RepID=A0A037ZM22_9RHOB|nr:hypothetical protein ACMU_08830 [Actibacterium mucosum KCTC 23349]